MSIEETAAAVNVERERERAQYAKPEPDAPPLIWNEPLNLPALIDKIPPDQQWFIADRIPAGRGCVCSGIGGSSKTTFMKQLAIGAVLKRLPWDWEVATSGRALLCLTEDTEEEAFRSIHFMCEAMDLTRYEKEKVYNGLILFPLAGEDVILLRKTNTNTLETSDLFKSLVEKIQEMGDCVFVGLDPALSLTDGDEQDQSDQRRLGKMCDNLAVLTGAAVMLICHAAKNFKEEISSHNSRGASSLIDAVRSEFVLRTMTRKEAKKAKLIDAEERFRHVQLVATKGNHLPPGAYLPVWLRRGDWGVLQESDISFSDGSDGITGVDREALKVLDELCQTGSSVKLNDWRNALIEAKLIKAGSAKTQETRMFRIRKNLYDNGLIQSPKRGYWEPDPAEADVHDFNDA